MEEKAETATDADLPVAGSVTDENNNSIAIIIAATITVLGSASTVLLVNRLRA